MPGRPQLAAGRSPRGGLLIALLSMAQLIVRNLDADLVWRLKRRAVANGRSVEEEHRQLLRQALRPAGLAEALMAMPSGGDDTDFTRSAELPRDIELR